MKRQIKNFVVAAASIAVTVGGTVPAQACGGRGGRSYVSVSRGHYPVARQPVYVAPAQPVCATPRVVQIAPQPVQQVIPAGGMQVQSGTAVQQASATGPNPFGAPAPTFGNTTLGNTAQGSQPATATNSPRPTATVAPAANNNSNAAEASALQMLVSISATQVAETTTSASNQPTSNVAARVAEPTSVNSQPVASHVGIWKASLPSNQLVELALNADGSFVWMAKKEGKVSTFQGQFRIESGKLTLVRSNDLQQMAGTWTGSQNEFTFKLGGANTGGLKFQRS